MLTSRSRNLRSGESSSTRAGFVFCMAHGQTNQTRNSGSIITTFWFQSRKLTRCVDVSDIVIWCLDCKRGCESGSGVESRGNGAISPSPCIISQSLCTVCTRILAVSLSCNRAPGDFEHDLLAGSGLVLCLRFGSLPEPDNPLIIFSLAFKDIESSIRCRLCVLVLSEICFLLVRIKSKWVV